MYNIVDQLKHTRSRNHKIKVLENTSKVFEDLLWHTYHPHMHYGIKKGLKGLKGTGRKILAISWDEAHLLLSKLAKGTLSGNAAKEEVATFIKSLNYFDGELFKAILLKDLRAGISVKTINKAMGYEFIPEFGVMLATSFPGTITGQVYMSIKLDGLRGAFRDGVMYSRNGKEIHGVERIIKALNNASITQADGELILPGEHFNTLSGKLRSHQECAEAEFHIFDTMDTVLPFKQRYEHMLSWEIASSKVKVMKHILTSDQDKIDATYIKAIDKEFEGLVLKDPYHMYKPNTRSKSWMKMKAVRSEDLRITGLFEGQGKYEGQAGGFLVERPNGVVVRVGSGFSDELRVRAWNKPEEYIGQTVEVLYHEETPDGSLRHPRIKYIRFDK